jgi:hypothetical protein
LVSLSGNFGFALENKNYEQTAPLFSPESAFTSGREPVPEVQASRCAPDHGAGPPACGRWSRDLLLIEVADLLIGLSMNKKKAAKCSLFPFGNVFPTRPSRPSAPTITDFSPAISGRARWSVSFG